MRLRVAVGAVEIVCMYVCTFMYCFFICCICAAVRMQCNGKQVRVYAHIYILGDCGNVAKYS